MTEAITSRGARRLPGAGKDSRRCATRVNTPAGVRPPCCSRPSWPLRVWLTDFDPLAHAAEVAVAVGLVLAVRAQQAQRHLLGELLELFAGEALVGQQDLPVADEVVVVIEQRGQNLSFADLGVGQAPRDGHAVASAHEVEL